MKRRKFLKSAAVGGAMAGGIYPVSMGYNLVKNKTGEKKTRTIGKRNLLFFFADEQSSSTAAVIPTLNWLAEMLNVDFESYVCIRPKTWASQVLAFNGYNHAEQFYYLANFYEKVLYCSLTESSAVQFKREVMAFGGDIITCRKPNELIEFYLDVFSYFKTQLPKDITVLPTRPVEEDALWIQPYCYPDVYFTKSMGIAEDTVKDGFGRIKEVGVRSISLVYCSEKTVKQAQTSGLNTKIVDSIQKDDTYAAVTSRITDRWIGKAKGIAFGDPSCTLKWQPYYLREGIITLYEPLKWKEFIKTVSLYARQTGNNVIYGNQMVKPMDDNVITYFSKEGLVMPLTGVDARIGTTLQTRKSLPIDWLKDIKAPWEDEYSDEFLEEKAQNGGIPVCFMFYAADIGHLPVLHRVFDLMLVDGLKCGLAFPCTWYEFQPELLEQLYIPEDLGGVFPKVEPLIVSAGIGVATEAEGFLSSALLGNSLTKAKLSMANRVGERLIPIGYYSFQDANPLYKPQTGQPPFKTLESVGFEYAITYKNQAENARIVYESDKFTAINQQNKQWFWHSWKSDITMVLTQLKERENQLIAEAPYGWIIFAFDMPSYGLCPHYLRGMEALVQAMTYASSGGDQKKLFIAKPHEVIRYARILRKNKKI